MNVINGILGVVNIGLFLVWASVVTMEVADGTPLKISKFDLLGMSLAVLELLVGVIALGLVALALVGWTEIKEGSRRRAEEVANKEVAKAIAELRENIKTELSLRSIPDAGISSGEATSEEAEEEESEEPTN